MVNDIDPQNNHPRRILGHKLLQQIQDATGLDTSACRRLIIDIPANEPVTIYAEYWGDVRLFKIDWAELLNDAKIIPVDPPEGSTDG